MGVEVGVTLQSTHITMEMSITRPTTQYIQHQGKEVQI